MGILQEFIELQEGAAVDYATMALFPHEDKSGNDFQLTLLDKAAFLKTTPQDFRRDRELEFLVPFVVAMVQVSKRETMGNCNGAWSVGASVRNPKYPGFGKVLYSLASAYIAAPVTSDKFTGTSDAARTMWSKIDADPKFKRTEEFDHFIGKTYYRRGEDGNYTKAKGPRTETPKDDCALPLDPKETIPFGYKSKEKFDFDALDDGLNQMIDHAKNVMGLSEAEFLRRVNDAGKMLFGQNYVREHKESMTTTNTLEKADSYRTIVESKQTGDYHLMSEASLQRVYQQFTAMKQGQPDASFAMLTSWRQSLTKIENEERFEHLKGMIRGMGLGFMRLDGYWRECSDPDVPYDQCPPEKLTLGKEKSLFIPGVKLEQAKKLMDMFDQDAVVYGGPEVSNQVSLVFRVDGSVVPLGDFTPDNLGSAWSELKGKAFHFEWVAQSSTEKLIESLFS